MTSIDILEFSRKLLSVLEMTVTLTFQPKLLLSTYSTVGAQKKTKHVKIAP